MKSVLVIEDNTDIRENTTEILDLAVIKLLPLKTGKEELNWH
jgi:hypothetical protein